MNKYKFYVDYLTPNDAELDATETVEAYDADTAVQQIRDAYEARGEIVFRVRRVNLSIPWQTTTVYLAKGQDY